MGDAEDFSRLFDAQAREIPALDHLDPSWLPCFQPLQRIVNLDEPIHRDGNLGVDLRQAYLLATAFLRGLGPGMIDQDAAHRLRSGSEEMRSAFPVHFLIPDQLEVGFVDEARRIECFAGALAPQIGVGYLAQIGVDLRQQEVEGFAPTALQIQKQLGNVYIGHGWPRSLMTLTQAIIENNPLLLWGFRLLSRLGR